MTRTSRRPSGPSQGQLSIANRQRARPLDLRLLRRIVNCLLSELAFARPVDLEICFAGERDMVRLNESYVRHRGPTDVIAFDYSEDRAPQGKGARGKRASTPRRSDRGEAVSAAADRQTLALQGEIIVCVDEALRQSGRYRTSFGAELIRYVAHGVLHLVGYDDQSSSGRRQMKREEDNVAD